MRISDLQSKLADQLYTCTDNYALQCAQPDFCCSAPAPASATAADATARSAPARLPHRALQTMWQAGLQMRSRPWSWPEVLPFGESLPATAANGLHSPGLLPTDHRISGQLSAASSDFGRDLRYQSRTVIASRGGLRNRNEPCPSLILDSLGCRSWQSAPPQHHRASPQPVGLCVPPPVNSRPSASPSREHGTSVCLARESGGTRLERSCDPHSRPRPGQVGSADGGTGRLQDPGGGCLHGASGCGVSLGSLPTLTLGPGLAPTAGVVCSHQNAGH